MRRGPLALLLLAGLAWGCSRGARPAGGYRGAPVVLISIDTLRADRLPAYGYTAVETPHLDRLRRDSILFANAYTHVPLTLPAHVSLLTGLTPPEHGVRDNLGYRVPASKPNLAALLKARGYATGGAVSAFVLRRGTGFAEGFDFFEDAIVDAAGGDALAQVQRPGSETARIALDWLKDKGATPFFLFLHIYEPHSPFDPPEPFKSRYASPYDGEVAASDAIVGEFLEELKRRALYDRSLIVLVSDHGEGLGDHGEEFHGILLYKEALHVPLMLKLPGAARAGMAIARPVALIDLLPTLGSLLELALPPGLKGRSLLDAEAPARRLYAETFYPRVHLGWSALRSLVDERFHYIDGPGPELFDIVADPAERSNLLGSQPGALGSFRKELAGYPADFDGPTEVAPEELEKLAALGYLGGGGDAPDGPLPDPKEHIHLLDDVREAFKLTQAGRDEEGVVALRKILDQSPLFLDVRYELARTLTRMQRYAEAYEAYRACLRGSPSLAGPISLALARICLELDRTEEAEANARIAIKVNPGQGHELLARVALKRNQLALAEREAGLAVDDPVAERNRVVLLAEIHIQRGQLPAALQVLDTERTRGAARKLAPLADLEFLRGDVLARMGRYQEAEAAFDAEIREFPRNSQAYARLAVVYGLQHRTYNDVYRLLEAMAKAHPAPETYRLAAQTLESMGDRRAADAWRGRAANASR